MKCLKHPGYTGKVRANEGCPTCEDIYFLKQTKRKSLTRQPTEPRTLEWVPLDDLLNETVFEITLSR